MQDSKASALRRKVAPPRRSGMSLSGSDRLERARLRFPRSADELLGLAAEVTTTAEQMQSDADVLRTLSDTDLIFGLEGRLGGRGLVALDAGLLAAIVEVQTIGRVSTSMPPARPPSRTDAVVASDLVDRWLSDLNSEVEAEDGAGAVFDGAVRHARLPDKRAVALSLDPGPYAYLRIGVALGDGAKTGHLSIALPAPVAASGQGESVQGMTGPRVVGAVEVDFRVDFQTFPVPLAVMMAIAPGTLLHCPADDLGRAVLRTIDGKSAAVVALGQVKGRWAIRITQPHERPASALNFDAAGDRIESRSSRQSADADPKPHAEPLPELPEAVAMTEFPDLPDLPPLPDMPDLPGAAD